MMKERLGEGVKEGKERERGEEREWGDRVGRWREKRGGK